jgi:hypothetical protein
MSFTGWFNWDRTGQLIFIRSSGDHVVFSVSQSIPQGRFIQVTFPEGLELTGNQPFNVTLNSWMHYGFSYAPSPLPPPHTATIPYIIPSTLSSGSPIRGLGFGG